MFKKLLLFTVFMGLLVIGIPICVYVIGVLLPQAIAIEKLADESVIQVRVVDRDTDRPIPDAVVRMVAMYPSYYPGFLRHIQSKKRGYWLTTDSNGVATIPMKYFLIKGMRYDSKFLCFFRGTRIADLPSHAKIRAEHEEYVGDNTEIGRGQGKFISCIEQNMLPEIQLRKKALVNTKRGCLSNSDRSIADGKEPSARTELFFTIDAKKKCLLRTLEEDEADFVINYEKIAGTEVENGNGDIPVWTGFGNTHKILSSIESLGQGGLAVDPKALRQFDQLSEVSTLNFQPSLSLRKNQGQPEFQVIVVRSRDGQRYAAINVGPRTIWWVYPKGESIFWHTAGHPGPFSPNLMVKDCRQFSADHPPDYRHWKTD